MSKHLEDKNLIARWMDGRLTEEEKNMLDKSGELDALKTVLDDIDTWKVAPFDIEKGLDDLKREQKGAFHLKRGKKRRWLLLAASIALLLSLGLTYYFTRSDTTIQATDIAEKMTIELPQGSLVELDAASSISYQKEGWNDERFLTLKGQAYFDITKGSPFVVNTATATITVLGTQFSIKSLDDIFTVSCYEGRIAVSFQENNITIEKGEQVTLKQNGLVRSQHQNSTATWLNGFNKYEQAPLNEVIADIKRYYQVDLTLPKEYNTLQFTGTIENKNLERTLHTLFTTMEISYTLEAGNKVSFH